jgi:membrane-associated phospholipid phosphatase
MFWQNVNFRARLKHTQLLWGFYLVAVLVWTIFYGDFAHVQIIAHQPWISANHPILKSLSDNVMYGFYAFFIAMLVWGYKSQDAQLRIVASGYLIAQAIGSIFIVRFLKIMLGRARPDHLAQSGQVLTDACTGPSFSSSYNSFPSGHTCDYLTSCFFLAMCLPKAWMRVLVIVLALFNGALRVMLAKHFPLDVLGGVIIGGMTSLCVWRYWILPRLDKV